MKKRSKIIISVIFFLSIYIFFIYNITDVVYHYNKGVEYRKDAISECEKVIGDANSTEKEISDCKVAIELTDTYYGLNFYAFFGELIVTKFNALAYFAFLIISIPSIMWICKVLKSKSISNYYLRESKKENIKRIFKNSYSYLWIIPANIIIVLIICLFICDFDPEYAVNAQISAWKYSTIKYPLIFIIIYLVNLTLYLATYVNIALIVVRRVRNYIVSLFSSYLLFMIFSLFCEFGIVNGFGLKLFPNYNLTFINPLNLFGLMDTIGLMPQLVFTLTMFLLTLLIAIKSYSNKEKLLLDIEGKN